ncbi:DeoR/GlpR family DNA-binding transcription regulator [Sporosarcina saromensis]|uniref:DeoR/GlpR family DNA-binding transcription regulator n=1 Tax=Sporosarcina saromensis TaxID=359365 RepID=A0ABU4GBD8_9BACL|nr:DeoR/GlpR family DNA-binding transcription regulator [Sporosarcina saromensis]MDW0114313.1 DeoR/GlpR family DNA-binding transcription regulator [Sporosarcina saromensis]
MFPLERQNKIVELLTVHKVLKISELTNRLQVSVDTLRRDVNLLTKAGKIEKIYGGVKIVETKFGESTINERMISNLAQKESIAQACSEYITDGDCIYIDSGSTTYQIAKYIKNRKNLTVVTNSIPVISELMTSDVELVIIGGKIRKNEQSVVTYDYLFNFDELNILKAFVCASGITIEKGISDYNLEEAITRKKMIERSKFVYVAADSSKFGKDVTINIAPLNKVDYLITDDEIDSTFIRSFKKAGSHLVVKKVE